MTLRSLATAPAVEPPVDLLHAYTGWLATTGRGCRGFITAARTFLNRWPDPQAWAAQPLPERLTANNHTRPFLTFLMLHGHLQPGFDWLIARKVPLLVRYGQHSPLAGDLARFQDAARQLGFSDNMVTRTADRVVVRLLIQTGRPLAALTLDDLVELETVCRDRAAERGQSWANDRIVLRATQAVLFHLSVVDTPPDRRYGNSQRADHRFADTPTALRTSFVDYLERLVGTHAPSTVKGIAIYLADFGRQLTTIDPQLASLADLDRHRHIEPYLNVVARGRRRHDGQPISVGDQRNRILAVGRFLADITEWGWPDAPDRKLIFARDIPRRPRTLPRYLPPETDRRLAAALQHSESRQLADALLLARATGLRIGELVDLELDCIHELPGDGAWLKVPLGKLDSERMVPLDDDTVAIVDRLAAVRSPGRPLPHPRTGRPAEFLLTHYGKRISSSTLRAELARVSEDAGLGHVTPHQLRHTFATALVNAGVSLQALMAMLGHTSAAMSLRYGTLFDATVRADYERALTLAKTRLGPVLPERGTPPLTDLPGNSSNWRQTDTIKGRLAGGYCLRTTAQGVCPYTNICEHCPNYRSDPTFLPILAAQRTDAETLAIDADARGWDDEATRHRDLVARLDGLIDQADAG